MSAADRSIVWLAECRCSVAEIAEWLGLPDEYVTRSLYLWADA